ncbi:hypothetical protein B0H14DRAFT_2654349 [Mycena olivaceomarginata]|nr:hypothetical protein B0H14DRAFT_2654349 [Mycena olivaceomarginata]
MSATLTQAEQEALVLSAEEFTQLANFMNSLEEHKLVPKQQIKNILQKAKTAPLSCDDMRVLAVASAVDGEDNGSTGKHAINAGKILDEMEMIAAVVGNGEQVLKGQVHDKPVLFKDQGHYAIPQLKGFGSLQQFFEMKREGCPITLALMCFWESPPVTETIAEWLDKDFHSNVLMVIHSTRNPSPGKALVICEPNIVDNDNDDEEPKKIPNVRMQKMIKKEGKMAKKTHCGGERGSGN